MAYRIGMAWLIIGCIVFLPGTFLITYAISVALGHVKPDFPYISDTGTYPPESCIFGQLLNIAAVFIGITMYVRYRQVSEHLGVSQQRLQRVNKVALVLGLIAAFGVSVVANFQETNVLPVHIIGALMAFGVGMVYIWMHGIMSYWTRLTLPPLNSHAVFIVRIMCCVLSTASFVVTILFGSISVNYDAVHPPGPKALYRNMSTGAEWVMAAGFVAIFATFINEFRKLQATLPTITTVPDDRQSATLEVANPLVADV